MNGIIKMLGEERAQGAVEQLGVVAVGVTVAIIVGYFLKTFVTKEVQPQVQQKTS